jgi:hypothetical protein
VLIRAFSADGLAAQLISLFCSWLAPSFFFAGGLFVANASFNNLGHPLLSTAFNWGRATMGTIPFAWWGSHYGAPGVLIGQAVGSSIFGLLAVVVAFRLAAKLARQEAPEGVTRALVGAAQAPVLDAPVAPTSAHGEAAALATPQPAGSPCQSWPRSCSVSSRTLTDLPFTRPLESLRTASSAMARSTAT